MSFWWWIFSINLGIVQIFRRRGRPDEESPDQGEQYHAETKTKQQQQAGLDQAPAQHQARHQNKNGAVYQELVAPDESKNASLSYAYFKLSKETMVNIGLLYALLNIWFFKN